MLSEKEIKEFKRLFSKYCRCEINAGRCSDDDCEFCAVDAVYEKIFSEAELDDEDSEDDEE